MRQHLVIAGGGQAAAQTAQSARQSEYQGRISIVGDEPHPPYQRPPLSKKFLAGEVTDDRLWLKSEDFYRSRDIDVLTGIAVTDCDPAKKTVGLSDGSVVEFTELVIATGATPRNLTLPGSELAGVHYLRSIADVEAIRSEFAAGKRLLVVGAGYIGLEVAAVAVTAGLAVTVVEAGDRAMARSVSPQVSAFFADYHRQHGVDFKFATTLKSLNGSDRVSHVETSDRATLDCDLVVIGIGVEPDTALARDAGLACADGVVVDAGCRTSAPAIFAAGDCTSYDHAWVGTHVRLESVQNAIEQGKAAGASVSGRDEPFASVPWFWSDQYDLKLQIAGLARAYDTTVVRGDIESGSFAVFYLLDRRVIAVDAINDPRTYMVGRQRLVDKPIWPIDAIADSGTDLGSLSSA